MTSLMPGKGLPQHGGKESRTTMDEQETKALSAGGTVPGEAGAGSTGAAPSGGGMAVPPDSALTGGGALGDTGSLDDAGAPGSQGALNSGTSLEEDAPAPGHTLTGGFDVHPQASGDGEGDQGGDAPTGGLSSGGTIGGAPTGSTNTGMGGSGL